MLRYTTSMTHSDSELGNTGNFTPLTDEFFLPSYSNVYRGSLVVVLLRKWNPSTIAWSVSFPWIFPIDCEVVSVAISHGPSLKGQKRLPPEWAHFNVGVSLNPLGEVATPHCIIDPIKSSFRLAVCCFSHNNDTLLPK